MKLTCDNLKMNLFIDCLTTGNTALVGGETAWEQLHSEYIGLRENKSTSYILDLIKEITYLQTKVFIIIKCVEVLAHTYSRDLVVELKQTGVKGAFDYSKKEQYSNELRAAITYSKTTEAKVKRKDKELKDYYSRHGGTVVQRKDFEINAVTLSEHFGYHVDYDIITVARYCHMMNQYEKYCEIKHAEKNNLIPE